MNIICSNNTNFKLKPIIQFKFVPITPSLDNGVISYEELRCFYAHFIKLPDEQVDQATHEAYSAMTSVSNVALFYTKKNHLNLILVCNVVCIQRNNLVQIFSDNLQKVIESLHSQLKQKKNVW